MIKIERYFNGNLELDDILDSIVDNRITECINNKSNTTEIIQFIHINLKEAS